jgi:NitT/TauT family transport system substrate-binding protein
MRLTRLFSLALALALLGFGSLAAQAQDRIRLGILPFSESLGAVMADKLGYFKAEGLQVEMSSFNGSALALPLLQAGKLDIAFSNSVSTLQAMEQGMDVAFIAAGAVARAKPPDTTAALIALKGTIKSPKDLEGKRLAVNVVNSTQWLYVSAYLDSHGVDRNKVKFVEIPFPQMRDPLLNKQVDVVALGEPFATVLLDTGLAEPVVYLYVDAQPNGDITQYISLNEWAKKNPRVAERFARAVRKGTEFVSAPGNEAVVRQVNMEFTNLSPALKDRVLLPRFGTSVNLDEIRKTEALMLKFGMLKKPVDLSSSLLIK